MCSNTFHIADVIQEWEECEATDDEDDGAPFVTVFPNKDLEGTEGTSKLSMMWSFQDDPSRASRRVSRWASSANNATYPFRVPSPTASNSTR